MDDPVIAISGNEDLVQRSFDALLAYWLLLGTPLAWKKGRFQDVSEPYIWIGSDTSYRQMALRR